ncbi:MAG: hypothetical protein QOE15_2579, partial [Acidimicrobiaceae bacterium]|nr:hypothetical protein [Acidimicrobiaceae bacterium]
MLAHNRPDGVDRRRLIERNCAFRLPAAASRGKPCLVIGDTYWTMKQRRSGAWVSATVTALAGATALLWARRRQRQGLAAYGADATEARRWQRLGLSAEQAGNYRSVGPAFVESWRAAGFTVEEMAALVQHDIFLDEALGWRKAGLSIEVASEWGRYRLSPLDVQAWRSLGFGANAAYTCKSLGLTPAEAVTAYENGESPAFAAGQKKGAVHVTNDQPPGWKGPWPPRDGPPDVLLSWN